MLCGSTRRTRLETAAVVAVAAVVGGEGDGDGDGDGDVLVFSCLVRHGWETAFS